MTASLRQAPSSAVDASRTDPITWASVRSTLLIAGLIGVFLSFVGAFGTDGLPFLFRTPFMVALSWAGAALGMVAFRLTIRLPWLRGRNRYLQGAVSALLMTAPMGLVVWSATQLLPHGRPPLGVLPNFIAISFVMCEGMTLFVVFMQRRAALMHAAPPPPPPKFLERLPLKLRGADVWAVEAEDHYLRLHTSKGQDLILMRLADAVDELAGIEGAQVHRSWWVAREAIADARRGDGRAVLTLKDGSEVPVSRTYAKVIRDAGWI